MNKRLKSIIKIAVMTALICAISPISVPFGVVPISLSTLIIMISSFIIGSLEAIISVLFYILIGLIGLPVFSSFQSGLSVLLGPTGGYIIGYVFIPLSLMIIKDKRNRFLCAIGIVLGNTLLYTIGTIWLMVYLKESFINSLMIGAVPFLITDLIKVIIVIIIGPELYKIFNTKRKC